LCISIEIKRQFLSMFFFFRDIMRKNGANVLLSGLLGSLCGLLDGGGGLSRGHGLRGLIIFALLLRLRRLRRRWLP
jgi:hypothetical protein